MEGLMVENQANLVPHTPGTGRYAVLKFDDLTNSRAPRDLGAKLIGISHSYMVVFPYGSVTMFNVHDHEIDRHLEIIKRHASGSLSEMFKCSGDLPVPRNYFDYEVREKPDLQTWMQGGPNYIMLQHLNIDGICTIGSVLGQSVALDYYCRLVDQLVNEYSGVNFRLEASGDCKKGIKQSILLGEMEDIAIAIYRFGLSERFCRLFSMVHLVVYRRAKASASSAVDVLKMPFPVSFPVPSQSRNTNPNPALVFLDTQEASQFSLMMSLLGKIQCTFFAVFFLCLCKLMLLL
ncbi:uncharacterized protein LOC113348274 [Papaver somniferum]|uniref:uncharacterized protein LOC113348274 n=1 Tax=Papaver somniferum TaxID=3469 RepID=UPI000E704983|nr:uncharacterized protein LOC113348274 [Papaver somniferum]